MKAIDSVISNIYTKYIEKEKVYIRSDYELLKQIYTEYNCTCDCFQQFCMIHKTDRKYYFHHITNKQRKDLHKHIEFIDDVKHLKRKYLREVN